MGWNSKPQQISNGLELQAIYIIDTLGIQLTDATVGAPTEQNTIETTPNDSHSQRNRQTLLWHVSF